MALSSTAAICNYSVPSLSSTNNITPSSLPPVAAQRTADVASVGTVAIPERRSTSINIPNTLANLLHLRSARTTDDIPTPSSARSAAAPNTPAFSPKEDISSRFEEIHGRGDWRCLIHPLHPWLRREIVKYGELAQATYDAFDSNPFSPFRGSCLFGRDRLLPRLGLAPRIGYAVSKYLYATSHLPIPRWLERPLHADAWSNDSNWIGFVSVSDDAESRRIGCRDIAVAWRGTVAPAEWFEDTQAELDPIEAEAHARVERGFLSVYTSKASHTRYNKTSASEQAMAEISRLVNHYRRCGERVTLTLTGHSLGGALALLNAYEAASTLSDLPVTVISFGAPRVGNAAFAARLEEMRVKVLRVAVKQDVVPRMPGILFNEGLQRLEGVTGTMDWVYSHVGIELGLDVRTSPYLKRGIDMAGFHNLEAYLHLVDGCAGPTEEEGVFRRGARRDVALVNKTSGMLRAELRIPPCWDQVANKGMVCNEYGRWVKPTREAEDIPSPYQREASASACPSGKHLINQLMK